MKILFESFTYYPLTSGVAVVVQTIAEGLSHLGHEVSVVTRKRDIKESFNNAFNQASMQSILQLLNK